MSKKGETLKRILDLIRSGNDTRRKVLHELGWNTVKYRQKLSYHIKILKDKGLIEEDERGTLKASLKPEDIADESKVRELIGLIKSNVKPVKEEALKEFQLLSTKKKICEPDAYVFFVEALDNPKYNEYKHLIFIILDYIYVMLMGTRFEKDFLNVMNRKPEFFEKIALNKNTDEFFRNSAMKNLVKIDQEKAFEVAFKIVLNPEETEFLSSHNDEMGRIGAGVRIILTKLSEENLERARKRGYSELKNFQNNEDIVERLSLLLEVVRSIQYPKENTKEDLKEMGMEFAKEES